MLYFIIAIGAILASYFMGRRSGRRAALALRSMQCMRCCIRVLRFVRFQLRIFVEEETGIAERYIHNGNYAKAVEHYARALLVCGRMDQVKESLRPKMSPEVFEMLSAKLEEYYEDPPDNMPRIRLVMD